MIDFGECEESTNFRNIVLQENRCKFTLVNNEGITIRKIKVDGCAIREGRRCDFLLILHDMTEYYVELKGCNVDQAIKQIIRTISLLSADKKRIPKYSFVVSTRCPLETTKIQQLKYRFKQNYNSKLIIQKINCSFTIQA
ncbi:MAG: hypothetical protein JW866_09780 [Ignavibacteriales bacterium]|nr:hypothetical protein [Ignavibacteriales bacterium]